MSEMEQDPEFMALVARFGREVEQLVAGWQKACGEEPSPADQVRITVAGLVALGARYSFTKAVVAKMLPKHVLLGLDKHIRKIGERFLDEREAH